MKPAETLRTARLHMLPFESSPRSPTRDSNSEGHWPGFYARVYQFRQKATRVLDLHVTRRTKRLSSAFRVHRIPAQSRRPEGEEAAMGGGVGAQNTLLFRIDNLFRVRYS